MARECGTVVCWLCKQRKFTKGPGSSSTCEMFVSLRPCLDGSYQEPDVDILFFLAPPAESNGKGNIRFVVKVRTPAQQTFEVSSCSYVWS